MLLGTISVDNPNKMVEVTARYEQDTYGPNREFYHMVIITVPEVETVSLRDFYDYSSDGVAAYSIPTCDNKGDLAERPHRPNLNYLVASWGSGSFYSYNLAEDVWMTMGLTPRCVGGDTQRIVYDDLSVPAVDIADGEVSNSYYYQPDRNIHWHMRNDYLRQYLWQLGHVGVRAFYYEGYVDNPEAYEPYLVDGYYSEEPESGWYELRILKHEKGIMLQVHGATIALTPEKCAHRDIHSLIWPGDTVPMTKARTEDIHSHIIYLRDSFLEKYEKNSVYSSTPLKFYDRFMCSPGYKGQWSFTECTRIGRNLIKVPVRELYKPKPDAEILHAYSHAISEDEAQLFDFDQEHIVSKVFRLVDQIINLGNYLHALADKVNAQQYSPEEYTGFSPSVIAHSHWDKYPIFSKLAQAIPIELSEQDFLSRCKTLSEIIGRVKSGPLKRILAVAGCEHSAIKGWRGLKLLQALSNILDDLIQNAESVDGFINCADNVDWGKPNSTMTPLFVLYDLRRADAHENVTLITEALERIDFDHTNLRDGHGLAFDFLLDRVIESICALNVNLKRLQAE